MARRHSVQIDISDADIAYGRRQNKFNCAIVRAIQRGMPEATHVSADAESVRFTLDYGGDRTRYVFETPRAVVNDVIRPFDSGAEIKPVSFTLEHALEAYDVPRRTREEKALRRQKSRNTRPALAKPKHETNRFIIPPTAAEQPLNELMDNLIKSSKVALPSGSPRSCRYCGVGQVTDRRYRCDHCRES